MDKRIKALAEWGCNTDDAVERMLGDEEFYLDCLHDMLDDKNFAMLKQALEADDVKAAFACAHTLKGVFANLSIKPMYEKAVEIVEPLRAGQLCGLKAKNAELLLLRQQLANIIASA